MSPLLGPPALAATPNDCMPHINRARKVRLVSSTYCNWCAAGHSFVGIARMDCLEAGCFDDNNCITQSEKSISMSVAYTTDKAAMRGHE